MMGVRGRGSGGFKYLEIVWVILENSLTRKVKMVEKNDGTMGMNDGAIAMLMGRRWYNVKPKFSRGLPKKNQTRLMGYW